ncbi:DUF1990 family protein [Dietzia psychralcaliphila]|uniref:DUF1990 family protein n=1 Tax=Dietzia psychralcaliphila TaxID=139021 RepID=UPI001C1DFE03|nr:DUF1990 domain-containing protein [Dietzia psychralcaliphila]
MSRAGRTRRFTREAVLGSGRDLLERAGEDLMNWEMHRRAGLVVVVEGPVAVGRRVRLRPRTGPAAWLRLTAPCEVTDVVHTAQARGFTYRALPGHPERGTETFLVHHDPGTDVVRLRIDAESAPATLLATLGAPIARAEQDRITRRYLAALGGRELGGR